MRRSRALRSHHCPALPRAPAPAPSRLDNGLGSFVASGTRSFVEPDREQQRPRLRALLDEAPPLRSRQSTDERKPDAEARRDGRRCLVAREFFDLVGSRPFHEAEMAARLLAPGYVQRRGRRVLKDVAQEVSKEDEQNIALALDLHVVSDGHPHFELALGKEQPLLYDALVHEVRHTLRRTHATRTTLSRHDQERVAQAFESSNAALEASDEVGSPRRVFGALREQGERTPENRQRCSQLVTAVGDEPSLTLEPLAFSSQCVIERAREHPYLVSRAGGSERLG